jgi:hypothetical protein
MKTLEITGKDTRLISQYLDCIALNAEIIDEFKRIRKPMFHLGGKYCAVCSQSLEYP